MHMDILLCAQLVVFFFAKTPFVVFVNKKSRLLLQKNMVHIIVMLVKVAVSLQTYPGRHFPKYILQPPMKLFRRKRPSLDGMSFYLQIALSINQVFWCWFNYNFDLHSYPRPPLFFPSIFQTLCHVSLLTMLYISCQF